MYRFKVARHITLGHFCVGMKRTLSCNRGTYVNYCSDLIMYSFPVEEYLIANRWCFLNVYIVVLVHNWVWIGSRGWQAKSLRCRTSFWLQRVEGVRYFYTRIVTHTHIICMHVYAHARTCCMHVHVCKHAVLCAWCIPLALCDYWTWVQRPRHIGGHDATLHRQQLPTSLLRGFKLRQHEREDGVSTWK